MPLLRLVAEGVGPFDRVELDLSDGKGNPHLGPHILAGVNGSGKSTILRAIAWIFDQGLKGFPYDEWQHLIAGHSHARALVQLRPPSCDTYLMAGTVGADSDESLKGWIRSEIPGLELVSRIPPPAGGPPTNSSWVFGSASARPMTGGFVVAAYSPSRNLRHIPGPSLAQPLADVGKESLSFQSTVQNDAVQNWLLSVYSKRAIAKDRHLPSAEYTQSLDRFEGALRLLYGEDVSFHVDIEPSFQPRLRVLGRNLNFSQLPDGIRATVGWIADYMRREDAVEWPDEGERPGILLLDEIDAHLHPLWQRKLLPALRKALPDVQIIVTSHSPFVISSCPGARVHVFDVDAHGKASNRPPVDSPIGESVQTTLKEIFGVDSRFDVQTEAELNEWNDLKKKESVSRLTKDEAKRLVILTQILSERSEELKSIVAAPLTIPNSVLKSLTGGAPKKRKTG